MGLPLSPALNNAFIVYFVHLTQKPHSYRQYIDKIFVLFTSLEQLEAFPNFLNGRRATMTFTIEDEKQNRMSFLDP